VVLYFIFRAIFKFKSLGETDFFPYVYCGVLILNFITRAIVEGGEQLHISSTVLRKIRFPAEILVLAKVSGNLINLFLGIIPLLIYLIFSGGLLSFRILLTPFVLLPLALIVSAVAIMLSVAYVFYRDIEHLVPTLLNVLFYISPVFYSIDLIGGKTRSLVELNPLNNFLESFRFLYGVGDTLHLCYISCSLILGILLLCFSLRILEKNRMRVILVS
jgi:ABC-type polysaccharide/polyol phosphate export permease